MPSGRRQARRAEQLAVQLANARQAWREHLKHCHRCHAAHGLTGAYCEDGWKLAQAITRARHAARVIAERAARRQDTLW